MISNETRFRCWQEPPEDIMVKIAQHLDIISRKHLSFVCKSWRAVALRRDIQGAPQLPWLVHPHSPSSNYLSFTRLSDGKLHNLRLPQGGCRFYGSSKSWLIMVMEQGLINSEMFLINPISAVQHKLPSFHEFVGISGCDHEADSFFDHIELSSADASECVVAAVFNSALGLCKLGDKTWTVFKQVIEDHGDEDGVVVARSLNFGDHVVELKLVFNNEEHLWNNIESYTGYYRDFTILVNVSLRSYLLEAKNEVLLIHQILDEKIMEFDEDDECITIMKVIIFLITFISQTGFLLLDIFSPALADGPSYSYAYVSLLWLCSCSFLLLVFPFSDEANEDDEGGDEGNNNNEERDDDEVEGSEDGGVGSEEDDEDGENDEEVNDNNEERGEDNVDGSEDGGEGLEDNDDAEGNNNEEEHEDGVEGNGNEEHDQEPNMYFRTSAFRIYKIGSNNNNFLRVQSLEDQILLVADQGSSLSLTASDFEGLDGNCIYFASNRIHRLHPSETLKRNISRDISVFYLDGEEMERYLSSFDMPIRLFTPNV
ncbi:hypothetical protein M0R45_024727 [Rubus argutus]|uniref:F-box domain-containing protein n=1 Tax=Rubus argutus TaxID=59490 RepID=A0AAW1WU09_RUBAR